jgi:hypothetical protein
MKALEAQYAMTIHEWKQSAIEFIAQRARLDSGASVIDKGLVSLPRLRQLRNDLMNLRGRMANFGRGQVADELKRQGA